MKTLSNTNNGSVKAYLKRKGSLPVNVRRWGCVTAVHFILFNFANYSPSIAISKVSKEFHVNDKIRNSRLTNMSPDHYF